MLHARNFKWLPNALTSVRYVLAVFVAISAANGRWVLSFWLLAAALITDFFDGLAAKKLDAKTEFGEQFDALADGTLVGTSLLGLGFAGELSWWVVSVAIVYGFVIGSDRLFALSKNSKLRKLRNPRSVPRMVISVGSLFIAWIGIAWIFIGLAFGWHWWYVLVTFVILAVLASLKRHRIRTWTGQS